MATISKDRLAAILATARAAKAAEDLKDLSSDLKELPTAHDTTKQNHTTLDRYGNLITYNAAQQEFIDVAVKGENAVLIGAAGTGKTTCMRGTIETLMQKGNIPRLETDHKHLKSGSPGIVIISYTRRAVANIKRVLPNDLKSNCITFHKLMEYEPEYFEVTDPETNESRSTMQFLPKRNKYNPLPSSIHTIMIEEASMLSLEYFGILMEALEHDVQFILLGDIYQLPPVFGAAILGYKLLEYPVVELTEIYRQALESPIISYATQIKDGKTFDLKEKLVQETSQGKITFHPWKKKLLAEDACTVAAKFLTTAISVGAYNPEEDMVLIPFNKAFGTVEINKSIAQYLATQSNSVVWEIIAGFNKHYFRVGEKIMYDKEDAVIVEIKKNVTYTGAQAQRESETLDYWGCEQGDAIKAGHQFEDESDEDIDFLLEKLSDDKDEDRVHQASHSIQIKLLDSDRTFWIDKAADINAILLGYALTVHKAQGSEWEKVFLLFHHTHATMLSRELLYTAITRAKKEVYCICEKDTFVKGVLSQRIKGNTLAEKAEYFKGKLDSKK